MNETNSEKLTITYILDEKNNVIPEPNIKKWSKWYDTTDNRIKLTSVEYIDNKNEWIQIVVSTVFLGLNNNLFTNEKPLVFETAIFGEPYHFNITRCSTYKESIQMHNNKLGKLLLELSELNIYPKVTEWPK